jgi:hypothetical protein
MNDPGSTLCYVPIIMCMLIGLIAYLAYNHTFGDEETRERHKQERAQAKIQRQYQQGYLPCELCDTMTLRIVPAQMPDGSLRAAYVCQAHGNDNSLAPLLGIIALDMILD